MSVTKIVHLKIIKVKTKIEIKKQDIFLTKIIFFQTNNAIR